MATLEIEFDVCRECGEILSAHSDRWGDLIVEPCGKCLGEAEERGYQRGNIESEAQ